MACKLRDEGVVGWYQLTFEGESLPCSYPHLKWGCTRATLQMWSPPGRLALSSFLQKGWPGAVAGRHILAMCLGWPPSPPSFPLAFMLSELRANPVGVKRSGVEAAARTPVPAWVPLRWGSLKRRLLPAQGLRHLLL